MEIVFSFLLFLLLTCLMTFSVWGALYLTYLTVGIVLAIFKGILKDRKLSKAVNGDLNPETKDLLALVVSVLTLGIAISIGEWTPVEVGMCLGAVIFYFQIWAQTGGTFSLPFRNKKQMKIQEANYKTTDLGKPIEEMSQEERRAAAEKIMQTIVDQAQKHKQDKAD